jgi:hypothetical protein
MVFFHAALHFGAWSGHPSPKFEHFRPYFSMTPTQSTFVKFIWRLGRPVGLACAVALLARLAVFLVLIVYPVANESGNPVSPMLAQGGADYSFYLESLAVYQGSFAEFLARTINTFDAPFTNLYKFVTSGPVLPALFVIFRYAPDNTLPLSLASLAVGTITAWLWIFWLHRRGIRLPWLLVFALLPNPIWYQINNSLDTYMALFSALFVITYLGGEANRARVAMGLGTGTLALLAKPNGLPLMIFMFADIVLYHRTSRWWLKAFFMVAAASLISAFFLFYMTYLISFLESSSHFSFFGVPYRSYLGGIYEGLPAAIDLPLSWLSLAAAKILYFAGLRPSYGVTPIEIVLIRSAPGIIILPGLLWLMYKRPRREALFVLLFLIPPFLGATQERYLLPIMPIVFLYGVVAFEALWEAVLGRFGRPSTMQATIERANTSDITGGYESEPTVGSTYRKPGNSKTAESRQ